MPTYITDATGTTVYDGTAVPEEPEEPEEPDTFRDDLLSSLESIGGDLRMLREDFQSVSVNDLEYHDDLMKLQQEMADVQQENMQTSYHLLAVDLSIAAALILTFGYTVAHGFFQRMKVG